MIEYQTSHIVLLYRMEGVGRALHQDGVLYRHTVVRLVNRDRETEPDRNRACSAIGDGETERRL